MRGRSDIAHDLAAWDREQARVRHDRRATYSSPLTYVAGAIVVAIFVAAYAIFFVLYATPHWSVQRRGRSTR